MPLHLGIRSRLWQMRMQWAKRRVLKGQAPTEIRKEDWPASLADPSGFYLQAFLYFHQRCPSYVRVHRNYFTQRRRGFGEDAFHAMWFLLVREFRPAQFLEIGVYRGQVLSLVALLQRSFNIEGEVTGISPFLPAGDSVSKYLENVEYYEDTLENFRRFNLRPPHLCRAFSTDPSAVELIRSRAWDCIYIDGNHDEAVVRADWAVCSESVKPGGVLVLDDSGLNTAYRPPLFATGGHPGPSALAREIDRKRFQEILHVGHNRVFQRL